MQCGPLISAAIREYDIAAKVGDFSEGTQHIVQEEPQPHAFSQTILPYQVHSIVPVARTHEGQPVFSKSKTTKDGELTVLVEACHFFGPSRQIVVGFLFGIHQASFQEVTCLVEHAGISGAKHVSAGGQRQPEIVIGALCANTSARGRVPPVLDVAVTKLTGSTEKQVRTQQLWLGMDKRHGILQLIAEAEGPPRLIESAAPPETA